MERLTEKEVIEGFKIDNALLGENESGTVERNNIAIKCIEELQEYRSICGSPEQLKLIDELYLERCEEINQLKAELAEYKKLEDEGLLLRLPCKVGSTVYHVVSNRILEVENVNLFFLLLSVAENRFGKTVFCTLEEAEQALERMKEVQDK